MHGQQNIKLYSELLIVSLNKEYELVKASNTGYNIILHVHTHTHTHIVPCLVEICRILHLYHHVGVHSVIVDVRNKLVWTVHKISVDCTQDLTAYFMSHTKVIFNSEIVVWMLSKVRLVLNRSEIRAIFLSWILYKSTKPDFVRMTAAVRKTNVHVRFVHCALICYTFLHYTELHAIVGVIPVEVTFLASNLSMESIRFRAQGDEENGSSIIQSVFSYSKLQNRT